MLWNRNERDRWRFTRWLIEEWIWNYDWIRLYLYLNCYRSRPTWARRREWRNKLIEDEIGKNTDRGDSHDCRWFKIAKLFIVFVFFFSTTIEYVQDDRGEKNLLLFCTIFDIRIVKYTSFTCDYENTGREWERRGGGEEKNCKYNDRFSSSVIIIEHRLTNE